MSMSTHVVGFKPPDDKWQKMRAVWTACTAAGIEPPEEVFAYFEDEEPDERGVRVDLKNTNAVTDYTTQYETGVEVDVAKLPPDVTIIRFYNSW